MTRARNCANCRFFNEADSTCRRYAPRPRMGMAETALEDDVVLLSFWPRVDQTDWCGEHQFDRDDTP
jgi:hypothetical protein